MKDDYKKVFSDKERILSVFAHPYELEIYCGATITRLISDGKLVRSVRVTSENKGSRKEEIGES